MVRILLLDPVSHAGNLMPGRFRNYEHVVRMAGVFMAGVAIFLIVRWILVPADFGVYGFYRAGAVNDAMARPMAYAGQDTCAACHTEVTTLRKGTKHEQVRCEACHGPLATHTTGDVMNPQKPDVKTVCLPCHQRMDGRPLTFPQITVADHSRGALCTACHKPHSPKVQK